MGRPTSGDAPAGGRGDDDFGTDLGEAAASGLSAANGVDEKGEDAMVLVEAAACGLSAANSVNDQGGNTTVLVEEAKHSLKAATDLSAGELGREV